MRPLVWKIRSLTKETTSATTWTVELHHRTSQRRSSSSICNVAKWDPTAQSHRGQDFWTLTAKMSAVSLHQCSTDGSASWLPSARPVSNVFTLVFLRRHWTNGRLDGFSLRTACEAERRAALIWHYWTCLHIAMTYVVVFKRGCIFMCNSFVVCPRWSPWSAPSFYNTWQNSRVLLLVLN